MAKCTITKIGLQTGTDRTVYVTWSWDKLNQTDKYDIRWYYATGDGVRFIGSQEEKAITNAQLQSTYTAPENATLVKFQVKPIAKTRKVNDTDVAYWTAEWSTEVVYNFSDNPPITPPAPSVKMTDYTLTASLTGLDVNGDEIYFEVVKDDADVFTTGIASIITSTASYSCSIQAGSKYKVRCKAKRGLTYSDWSPYSANIDTLPYHPEHITQCYSTSGTSIYISWTAAIAAETYDIEYATKPEYLGASNAATTVNNIKGLFYNITGLQTGEKYYFRVRAVNPQGSSGWTEPVCVILGSQPEAPTTWSSTTTAIVGEQIILYWVHNTEDGSRERVAELEIYMNGETTVRTVENPDYEDDATNSYFTINTSSFGAGTTIEWRVRTAGITMVYGDWSIKRAITVYAPATLELHVTDINGKDIQQLTSFPFYIKGIAGPKDQNILGYHVSITAGDSYKTIDEMGNIKMINKGDEVYSKFYDTDQQLLLELTAGSIDLENNIEYTASCMTTMGSGLSARNSVNFRVAWTDAKYDPNAEMGYDPNNLSLYIRPYCEDDNGELINDVTLSVYRREHDGRFVEIAKGLNNTEGTFVTDPHPSLDYARYRVVAIDNVTGAVSYSDIPGYPVGEKSVIIQWNEQWSNFQAVEENPFESPVWSGSVLKLPYNIDVSESSAPDTTLVKYIGRQHPVSYYGTQVGSTATWNVDVAKADKNTVYALRRLSAWMGDVYVREPSGSGYWANITVSFNQNHCELVIPVTLNITRVEGGI